MFTFICGLFRQTIRAFRENTCGHPQPTTPVSPKPRSDRHEALNEYRANDRGFYRSCHGRHFADVGDKPVAHRIVTASADKVNHLIFSIRQFFVGSQHSAIRQRQAFTHTSNGTTLDLTLKMVTRFKSELQHAVKSKQFRKTLVRTCRLKLGQMGIVQSSLSSPKGMSCPGAYGVREKGRLLRLGQSWA